MKPFIMVGPDGFPMSFILPDQVAAAMINGNTLTISLKAGGSVGQVYEAEYAAKYAMSTLLRLVEEEEDEGEEPVKVNMKGQRLLYEAVCQGDSRCGWSQEINHRINAPEKCPECGGSVGSYPIKERGHYQAICQSSRCGWVSGVDHPANAPKKCPACGSGITVQNLDGSPLAEEGKDSTIKCMTCTETFVIGANDSVPTECPACGQGPIMLVDANDPTKLWKLRVNKV